MSKFVRKRRRPGRRPGSPRSWRVTPGSKAGSDRSWGSCESKRTLRSISTPTASARTARPSPKGYFATADTVTSSKSSSRTAVQRRSWEASATAGKSSSSEAPIKSLGCSPESVLSSKYRILLHRHPGFALTPREVPPDFRGPRMAPLAERVARFSDTPGELDAVALGRAAEALHRAPQTWREWGTPEETWQHIKQLWHVLVRFGRARPTAAAAADRHRF